MISFFFDENMPGLSVLYFNEIKLINDSLVVMITKSEEEYTGRSTGNKIADYLINLVSKSNITFFKKESDKNKLAKTTQVINRI